jgi:hypothetical protein
MQSIYPRISFNITGKSILTFTIILLGIFVEDKIVTLEHIVATEKQLADIFTKALDANQFEKLKG